MAIELSILVANVDSLIAMGHSRIEVWRSVDGLVYEEVTAPSAMPAELFSGPAQTTFKAGGKLLKVVNGEGAEQSISFDSLVTYWTPDQVMNRVNEVVPGLASVVENKVRLASTTTGRSSSLRVTYCDVPGLFVDGDAVYGKAARIVLVSGTLAYTFRDPLGRTTDRYKWRYSDNGSGPISEYSSPVFGSVPPSLDSSKLCAVSARFYEVDGRPAKRRVVIGGTRTPQQIDDILVGSSATSVVEANSDGFLQVNLVRGAKVRIAIEGTGFVRDVTVPDAASADLMELLEVADDPFTISSPAPLLTRRSM